MSRIRFVSISMLLAFALGILQGQTALAGTSKGQLFYFAFQPHLYKFYTPGTNLKQVLYIGAENPASGKVSVPGLGFETAFNVTPGELSEVVLPLATADMPLLQISNKAVIVTADADVTVYGLNSQLQSSDAFLALPVAAAGTEYMMLGYYRWVYPELVSIVGIYDNTEVTLSPRYTSRTTGTRRIGTPFTIKLNSGDVYVYTPDRDNGIWFGQWDVTGSSISATAPVAVMGGAECSNVPYESGYCDHLTEQLPPLNTWGKSFLVVPSATRLMGDIVRILASEDDTEVRIDGEVVATLAKGQFIDRMNTRSISINTSSPAMVTLFAVGSRVDGAVADPFMMVVPPVEQYLKSYNFISIGVQEGFPRNYVNVVTTTADIASLLLDGQPVDVAQFQPIADSGFSGAQLSVEEGSHTIEGAAPVGIFVYGFGDYDSYGYPGGMNFDLINGEDDIYAPNIVATRFDDRIEFIAGDSEDLNLNEILESGEDINGNGVIDRRSEDINLNGVLDAGEDQNGNNQIDRDSGLYRIELAEDAVNLKLELNGFAPGTLRASFSATAVDPDVPAAGEVLVQDGGGNIITYPVNFESAEVRFRNVRLVSTLSSEDIELDYASFTTPPDFINRVDGRTVLEWFFDNITLGQLEQLDYEVIVRNATANQQRVVTHDLEIYYSDLDGRPVHQSFGARQISVLPSAIDVGLSLSSAAISSEQSLELTGYLRNLSQFDVQASYAISLLDAQGTFIRDLATSQNAVISVGALEPIEALVLDAAGLYRGEYRILIEVTNADGTSGGAAEAVFSVVADDQALYAAKVSTDKLDYRPNETVAILNRVNNAATNALLTGASASTRIENSAGEAVWLQTQMLPTINVGSQFDFEQQFALLDASPGTYRVVLDVLDEDGATRASSEYAFTVQSTQDTGAGIQTSLMSLPASPLRTEAVALTAVIANHGNSDVSGIPMEMAVVDVRSQQTLDTWPLGAVSLPRGAELSFTRQWVSSVPADSSLMWLVTADFSGEPAVPSTQRLALAEKFAAGFAAEGRGRVLVLMDAAPTAGAQCRGLGELALGFRPGMVWQQDDLITVELIDGNGSSVDSEELRIDDVDDVAQAVNAGQSLADDLAIAIQRADALALQIIPPAMEASLSGSAYHVRISVRRDGGIMVHESEPVSTACDQVDEGDVLSSSIQVTTVYGVAQKEAHGPQSAPDALTQEKTLRALLDAAGWQYRVVHDAPAFAEQLSSGGYAAALMMSEQIKLPEPVQAQLADYVGAGNGLIVAGVHDQRNSRLQQILGVDVVGQLANVEDVEATQAPLVETTETATLMLGEKPLRLRAGDTHILAWFQGKGGERLPAVTMNTSGTGKSLMFAFDVLQQLSAEQASERWQAWLLAALDAVQPAGQPLYAGAVVPITASIENLGDATAGELTVILPPGTAVIDPGAGQILPDGALFRGMSLDADSAADWTFWIRLPEIPGPLMLEGTLRVLDAEGAMVLYGPVQAELNVVAP